MGRYTLAIVVAVIGATSITMLQSKQSSLDEAHDRAKHQKEILARQIAWSGFNAILAEARYEDRQGRTTAQVLASVDRKQAQVEGGEYDAWLEEDGRSPGQGPPGHSANGRGAYYVVSEGTYQGTTVRVRRLRQMVTNGNGGGPPGGGPPGGGPPGGGPPGGGPPGGGPPGGDPPGHRPSTN